MYNLYCRVYYSTESVTITFDKNKVEYKHELGFYRCGVEDLSYVLKRCGVEDSVEKADNLVMRMIGRITRGEEWNSAFELLK